MKLLLLLLGCSVGIMVIVYFYIYNPVKVQERRYQKVCTPGEIDIRFSPTITYQEAVNVLASNNLSNYSVNYRSFEYMTKIPLTDEQYDSLIDNFNPQTDIDQWFISMDKKIVESQIKNENGNKYFLAIFQKGITKEEITDSLAPVNLHPGEIEYWNGTGMTIHVPYGKEIEISDMLKKEHFILSAGQICLSPLYGY